MIFLVVLAVAAAWSSENGGGLLTLSRILLLAALFGLVFSWLTALYGSAEALYGAGVHAGWIVLLGPALLTVFGGIGLMLVARMIIDDHGGTTHGLRATGGGDTSGRARRNVEAELRRMRSGR